MAHGRRAKMAIMGMMFRDVFNGLSWEGWAVCANLEHYGGRPFSGRGARSTRHASIILLQCFLTAENDYEGEVNPEAFDLMVEMVAKDMRQAS